MLNYLDDQALLGFCLVDFQKCLSPPKPLHTKFHDNRWSPFRDSGYKGILYTRITYWKLLDINIYSWLLKILLLIEKYYFALVYEYYVAALDLISVIQMGYSCYSTF